MTAVKWKSLKVLTLFCGFMLLCSSLFAGTAYYRWTDERGDLVVSDRPPENGVEYEVVRTDSTLKRVVDAEEGAVPAETEPTVENDFEQVDTWKPPSLKNPEYCARARDNLKQLETVPRIRMRDENGEFRWLSDEEKAEQRQKALEGVETFCE